MSTSVVAVHPDPASLPRGQQERRDRIVRAAITLLEHGEYDAIQMRDVAQEAGVALATVYRYFTSKEHLYAAALLEWAANFPAREPVEARRPQERRGPAARADAPGGAGVRALPADDARRDRARELDRSERSRAVRPVRGAQRRRAHERAVVDRRRHRGRHRRDGQQRAGDAPPVVGARPHHHRRGRPIGAANDRPDLRDEARRRR